MANAFWSQSALEPTLDNPAVGAFEDIFVPFGDSMIIVNKHGDRIGNEKVVYQERTQSHFVFDPFANEYPNLVQFMVHMREVIDVGRAFDRAGQLGVLKTSIGQHSNDLMLSFYATGPGGIDVEVATLGERHDNATWRARELAAFKACSSAPSTGGGGRSGLPIPTVSR